MFEPIETITEKEFHREFDTNVLGTIFATQEALESFPQSGGRVIKHQLNRQRKSGP
jgi:3-oxoacyl-[acyl-carrier protein] reductase